MSPSLHTFVSTDLPPLLTATLAAISCALLGNFLVLRRQSLMGDAISHAVLPGLVAAFLIAGTRSTWPMFIGAAAAGVATVVLVELVRRLGRVEPGAAMGVVFSIMFALGVVLLEQAAARHVDLDADCVLYGQLETIFWFPPGTWSEFLSMSTLAQVPRQPATLAAVTVLTVLLVTLLFKELRLAAFDPDLATVTEATEATEATNTNTTPIILVGDRRITAFRRFFAEEGSASTEPFAIWGSAGLLELAVFRDSAARLLNARRGQTVTVMRTED